MLRRGDTSRIALPLFIIGVELLSLQIKSNSKIKGALVNDTESLISQYTDDTFLVLDGCETSLRETLICFENFNKASGLKINTSKTRVVWWEVRGIPIKFVVQISNWTGLHPISNYLEYIFLLISVLCLN
jgi:hypothetical protein